MGIDYGKFTTIEDNVTINVKHLKIGDRTIIRSGARIEGFSVVLGTECYLDHNAVIGGGSCFDKEAYLIAGDWLHMGWNSQINIARGVNIGHEVGLGIETKIFTHGAYPAIDRGFPAQWGPVIIGDNSWLPNAWVNPCIEIGDDVVVAAKSLVNINLPDGCLAGGIPVKILKESEYPKPLSLKEIKNKLLEVLRNIDVRLMVEYDVETQEVCVHTDDAVFNITKRHIIGKASYKSEAVKNQLRRNGIRFRYTNKKGEYISWKEC